jgi:hypothetical protein
VLDDGCLFLLEPCALAGNQVDKRLPDNPGFPKIPVSNNCYYQVLILNRVLGDKAIERVLNCFIKSVVENSLRRELPDDFGGFVSSRYFFGQTSDCVYDNVSKPLFEVIWNIIQDAPSTSLYEWATLGMSACIGLVSIILYCNQSEAYIS